MLWWKQGNFRLNLSSRRTLSSHLQLLYLSCARDLKCAVLSIMPTWSSRQTQWFIPPSLQVQYHILFLVFCALAPREGQIHFLSSTVLSNQFVYTTGHTEEQLWIMTMLLCIYIFHYTKLLKRIKCFYKFNYFQSLAQSRSLLLESEFQISWLCFITSKVKLLRHLRRTRHMIIGLQRSPW